jgi:hypothetical protein
MIDPAATQERGQRDLAAGVALSRTGDSLQELPLTQARGRAGGAGVHRR